MGLTHTQLSLHYTLECTFILFAELNFFQADRQIRAFSLFKSGMMAMLMSSMVEIPRTKSRSVGVDCGATGSFQRVRKYKQLPKIYPR